MPEFHVPMTLVVEAEDEAAAHLNATLFERTREGFHPTDPWRWMHVGLSPKAKKFAADLRSLISI